MTGKRFFGLLKKEMNLKTSVAKPNAAVRWAATALLVKLKLSSAREYEPCRLADQEAQYG